MGNLSCVSSRTSDLHQKYSEETEAHQAAAYHDLPAATYRTEENDAADVVPPDLAGNDLEPELPSPPVAVETNVIGEDSGLIDVPQSSVSIDPSNASTGAHDIEVNSYSGGTEVEFEPEVASVEVENEDADTDISENLLYRTLPEVSTVNSHEIGQVEENPMVIPKDPSSTYDESVSMPAPKKQTTDPVAAASLETDRAIQQEVHVKNETNILGGKILTLNSVAEAINFEGTSMGEVIIDAEQANIIGAHIETLVCNIAPGNQCSQAEAAVARETVIQGTKPSKKFTKKSNIKEFLKAARKETSSRWKGHKLTEDYAKLNEPEQEYSIKKDIIPDFFSGGKVGDQSQYTIEGPLQFQHQSNKSNECKNLVQTVLESLRGSRTAILGPAGSGKTTEIKRFVRDICASSNAPDLVHFLSFRDIPVINQTTPCDLLFGHLLLDDPDDLPSGYQWLLKNQSKVVFVFDGLDQATWNPSEDAEVMRPYDKCSTSVIMSNILNKKLFPGVKIVYTSREHSVADLSGKLRPDVVIALAGLFEENIETLFKSFVGENSEKLCKTLVTESHSLLPLLTVPAFLVFTAVVYKSNPDNPPKFVTGVMLELLEIFKRSGHITEKSISDVMKGLEKMSFDGMMERTVLFMEKHVEDAGLTLEQICDWVIIAPGTKSINQYLLIGDKVMFFSHQIIQEVLSSKHISTLSLSAFRKIVEEQLVKEHWSVVTRFLSGILLNKESTFCDSTVSDLEEKRRLLKNMLTLKYNSAKNATEKLSVMATISETNDKDFVQGLIEKIDIEKHPLSPSAMHVISSVVSHCPKLEKLRLWDCSLDDTTWSILWKNIHCDFKVNDLDFGFSKVPIKSLSNLGRMIENDSTLHLAGCELTSTGLECLKDALGNKKIKNLNLGYNFEIDQYLDVVETFIADGCSLSFQFCAVTSSGLQKLKTGLMTKTICEIDISRNAVDEDVASTLADVLKNHAIDRLKMHTCHLSDAALHRFLSGAEELRISELTLSENTMDEEMASTVAKIIKKCSVDKLRMRRCFLTDTALNCFLSEAEGSQLSYLDVAGNNHLSGDVIRKIRQSINVKTIDSDYESRPSLQDIARTRVFERQY